MSKKDLEFGLDHRGEFDEVWLRNAFVHIERMDDAAYWIGIDAEDGRRIMVNTGVWRGEWYFNVYEDATNGRAFDVRRPRTSSRQLPHEAVKEVLDALRETLDVIGDAEFAGRKRVEMIFAKASKRFGAKAKQ